MPVSQHKLALCVADDLTGKYAELIGAETPEEVYQKVRQWTSNLTEKEHLIRSIILDIHAALENRLKEILGGVLSPLIINWGDDEKYEGHQKRLMDKIRKMSFMRVYELLRPAFDAFDRESADLALLSEINSLRNAAAHAKDERILFRGRSLFEEHDAVAHLFFSSWAINSELNKFVEKMIDDRLEFERVGHNVYRGKSNPMEK